MGLRIKFNLVLMAIFLLGLGLTGWISHSLLQHNARDEVLRTAGLMMESAIAIREYTVEQIRPHLKTQLVREFLPQSVPAYAAAETINKLTKPTGKLHDYAYKEAALNPTNPRDRPTDWETDVVQAFRKNQSLTELIGERNTPMGRSLYFARPIEIKSAACLECHGVPSAASPSMIKLYGQGAGFGWKLNEIVGAQIISVPMSLPIANANRTFRAFMISLLTVFVVVFAVLNMMLSWLIVRPIQQMSKAANQVSIGNVDVPELSATGKGEIALLAASFNRMKRSLQQAMELLNAAKK